jgi:hypothetical protein
VYISFTNVTKYIAYCHVHECDCIRKVGLIIVFILRSYTQLVTTSHCSAMANSHSAIHYSTHLILLSLLYLHQSLLGSGFNGRRSPSSGFTKWHRASVTGFSQQQRTRTEQPQSCNLTHSPTTALTNCSPQLVPLITSRHGPSRKHHSSVVCGSLHSRLSRCRRLAMGLHAIIL